MARLVFAFVSFVWLACAAGLLGCEPESVPQLISVSELNPREVEVGDRLEISGTGFPQGKMARVSFQGVLYRPGEHPARGAVIDAEGTVTGRDSIEVAYTEALDAEFCGIGERRRHTTFEGDVEISFAAASKGAPPVNAVLHHVTLDLRPPEDSPQRVAERTAEAEHTLAALGIHPGESPAESAERGERGILVKSVDPGSRAEEAGILAEDVIVAFAGVRIGKLADALVPSGVRDIEIHFRRGAAAREEKRTVRTLGIDGAMPVDLFGAALIALTAVLVLLLFATPSRGPMVWLERRFAVTGADTGAPPLDARHRRLCTVLTSLLLALVPLAHHAFVAALDASTVALTLFVAVATLALLTSGSFLAGLRGVFRVLTLELPAMFAVAGAMSAAGSLRLRDIVSVQGGWPWEWTAFQSPPSFLLFLLLLASTAKARFEPRIETNDTDDARAAFRAVVEHVHLLALAGLAAVVFLGGWKLPFLAPGAQRASALYSALGAGLFLAKVHGLVALFERARRAVVGAPTRALMGVFWRWLIPMSALGLLATFVWGHLRIHPELQSLVAMADVVLLGLLLVRWLWRTGRAQPELHLNPFL